MSKMRRSLIDIGHGRVLRATVVDVVGRHCSVRLADGTLLRGIPFTGGPLSAGMSCLVSYQSGTPVALLIGTTAESTPSRLEKRRKIVASDTTIPRDGGDMLKAIYDTDDDGVVDEAEAVAWSGVTGKPNLVAIFTTEGDLAVDDNPLRLYNTLGRSVTISKVLLSVATAPTGAALIVDIHKDGTTIFTTQSNRPQVAAGANSGYTTTIEVATWADGEYLTMHIDQVGSTVAGADMVVHIVYQ